ncbi:hypothetical protein [Mycolicibacterium sp. 120270]|uniref:hypothetical protein n=1 Tax=Mycolicibacterium sp. 120270 TaxID=3090600 RepID=UPI00299F2A47|nr:hypothetical protein [Mycolicibacterium sp. 120270]MDX1884716.1 hypothetical protein [Mycolicibacterium sp. 120270]
MALRREGLPYREIAERLDWKNEASARSAVTRLLTRIEYDEVAEMRAVEGERLDALQRAVWAAATSGDTDAIKSVLAIMARRARLFGLDMPAKVDVPQMSSVEFAEEFVRLVNVLDPQGLAEAISHLPGGSSAAVELSRDVLLGQADSPMQGGHRLVVDIAESVRNGTIEAGNLGGHPVDEFEPWSNI